MLLRGFLVLTCLLISGSAFAHRDPIVPVLEAKASGDAGFASLELRFHLTQDSAKLQMPIRVIADRVHHDALTVTLVDPRGVARTTHFIASREQSATETITLVGTMPHVETIDLTAWTGALAPGHYSVLVTWRLEGYLGTLTATTSLDMTAGCGLTYRHMMPAPAIVTAPPRARSVAPIAAGALLGLLLVGAWGRKRAGAIIACVPDSLA